MPAALLRRGWRIRRYSGAHRILERESHPARSLRESFLATFEPVKPPSFRLLLGDKDLLLIEVAEIQLS